MKKEIFSLPTSPVGSENIAEKYFLGIKCKEKNWLQKKSKIAIIKRIKIFPHSAMLIDSQRKPHDPLILFSLWCQSASKCVYACGLRLKYAKRVAQ